MKELDPLSLESQRPGFPLSWAAGNLALSAQLVSVLLTSLEEHIQLGDSPPWKIKWLDVSTADYSTYYQGQTKL